MVKRKKNADAPRGAMGAYMFFCKSNRDKIKEENPGIDVRQILSELGRRWGALSDAEKEPYKRQAEQDKVRFEREKESYLRTHGSMYQEMSKKKKKKKKKKDPNAPKKNRSSYILFVSDHRQQAINELPEGAKQVEIMSRVAEMWRDASESVRKKYTKMAEDEKQEYERKLQQYNASGAGGDEEEVENAEEEEEEEGLDGY